MPPPSQGPSQEPTQQNTCPNASSQPNSASTTQVEPRAAAAAAALAAEAGESTRPFSQPLPLPDSSAKTAEIEARVATIAAVLAAERELQHETKSMCPEAPTPTVEQVTALLADALSSMPDARLLFASSQFSKDMSNDSSIVQLSQKIEGRVTFGVIQQTQTVDFSIDLPFNRVEAGCRIFYDPGSDNCLLVNQKEPNIFLTGLSSSPSTRARVVKDRAHVIRPGMWRISLESDKGDDVERHLAEFLLLRRQFSVAIHKAIDAPSAKRATNDNGREHPTKRQRLESDVTAIVATPSTNKTTIELAPVNADASNVDSHHLTTLSSVREIVNKAAVPFLELTDGETAVIRTPQLSSATSQPKSTVNGPATYQLRRVKHLGATKSTSVFACRHSAMQELVVAKVLRQGGESAYNVAKFARLWKREKQILDNLKHRSIVALKAFDGRMFALYLEHLPPSLFRGLRSSLELSDAYIILHDTSSALAYLAAQSIVHNDIKPLNITYSPHRGAVLIDFGMATGVEPTVTGGSPWYLPPEFIGKGIRGSPGDVWALGITMLYVLGKIEFPERAVKGWAIGDVSTPGDSNTRMKDWLQFITRNRDTLNQVNKGDKKAKIEYIVFSMLEDDRPLRFKPESITSALDAIELDPVVNRLSR